MPPTVLNDPEEVPVLSTVRTEEEHDIIDQQKCSRPYLVEPVVFIFSLAYFAFITLNVEYLYVKVRAEYVEEVESSGKYYT